ncbi:MAG: DUF4468 domain-containing protein [Mucilaginibacter sp.]
MKKLLFAAALLIPFISKAQSSGPFNYKVEDRYLYYSDVVKVDTTFTTTDLYKDAKLFIVKMALTNTKITTDDQKGGMVAVDIEEPGSYKTQTGLGDDEPMTLKYSIKIEMKQGRYRYTIDNILVTYPDKDNKPTVHTLYDMDKEKGGGVLGVGRTKRVLKAMDALLLRKIDLLSNTMKKKSDDF